MTAGLIVIAAAAMGATLSTLNTTDSPDVVADAPTTTSATSSDTSNSTTEDANAQEPLQIRSVDVSPFDLPVWLEPRAGHSLVWTGEELIVWGGWSQDGAVADGAIYNPRINEWRTVAESPLEARSDHVAVWTGEEMLVVGGQAVHASGTVLADSAAYDPATDSWRATPNVELDAPNGGELLIESVWTGELLVLWDRDNGTVTSFDPTTDTWTELPSPGLDDANVLASLRWTGTQLVALAGDGPLTAATLTPTDDSTWQSLPAINFIDPFPSNSAVTDAGLVLWSRSASDDLTYRLDETARQWIPAARIPINPCEGHPEPLSLDDKVFVMNLCFDGDTGGAAVYNPETDTWDLTDVGTDDSSNLGEAIWTGNEVLVVATTCCDSTPLEWAGTRYQFD